MSHFTKIKVTYDQKYEAQLIKALEEHFGEGTVEIHPEGAELRTYSGALASGAGLGQTEKSHLIIRRKTQEARLGHGCATNDAGFARNNEGKYNVYVDEAGFNKNLQGLVSQSYSLLVAESQFQMEGYMTERVQKEDGTIRLEARLYA